MLNKTIALTHSETHPASLFEPETGCLVIAACYVLLDRTVSLQHDLDMLTTLADLNQNKEDGYMLSSDVLSTYTKIERHSEIGPFSADHIMESIRVLQGSHQPNTTDFQAIVIVGNPLKNKSHAFGIRKKDTHFYIHETFAGNGPDSLNNLVCRESAFDSESEFKQLFALLNTLYGQLHDGAPYTKSQVIMLFPNQTPNPDGGCGVCSVM